MQGIASTATVATLQAEKSDAAVRHGRIKAHLGLVRSIARRLHARPLSRGVELDDLVAYGAKGLVEAASRFDGRDIPFAVFARSRIRGAIMDGIRAHHWFGRRADRRIRVERLGGDWDIELPTAGQVRNDTRWNGRTMACAAFEADDAISAQVAIALRSLPVRERRLVDLCYYEGRTLSQAAKEMGLGCPWASRLHARALGRLRGMVRDSGGRHAEDRT